MAEEEAKRVAEEEAEKVAEEEAEKVEAAWAALDRSATPEK